MDIKTIILAAGKGTRMRSNKAKVLHKIAGKSMLQKVVESVSDLNGKAIVVYGHDGVEVKKSLTSFDILWVEQSEQLGTGHAVQQGINAVKEDDVVLILYGDIPLIKKSTLAKMINRVTKNSMSLLTVNLENPTGYGRIVRTNNDIQKIVEQKDATQIELEIKEVNTGIMAVNGGDLAKWLSALKSDNAQNEYYLTDIIEMAVKDKVSIVAVHPQNEEEVQGVNSKSQLNKLERHYQHEIAQQLMDQGATLGDATRVDVRGDLVLKGVDVYIDCNVIFEGRVELGQGVIIGANSIISNAVIHDNAHIKPNSVLEDCVVGENCTIGPFARIRPGTVLADRAHVGNFVEIKKSNVGKSSKINHLSYIGDADIGTNVNIGAGTITCNYDGVNKFKTIIEDDVFIGSDTQLVAPVTIKKGASIGAGTTLTKDAPDNALTLSRSKQITVKGWKKPIKD